MAQNNQMTNQPKGAELCFHSTHKKHIRGRSALISRILKNTIYRSYRRIYNMAIWSEINESVNTFSVGQPKNNKTPYLVIFFTYIIW